MGIETCAICSAPEFKTVVNHVGNSVVHAKRIAVFDTIATYVRGRIVDKLTHQSIKGAHIATQFCSAFRTDIETKTATTDENGLFTLGWVGHNGAQGQQSNRLIVIQAPGYENINTTAVAFGASAYLHIELAPLPRKH
ncbi:hypothetical protein GCM10022409_12400 [Hymenobacter glaciei]|uniref:Carboxypeptidase regulatory-like domain-containing protein n=2 Tax=Hymenobacter glaciei TaxID=877209 RepID=A0ABP7TQD2_9BACT